MRSSRIVVLSILGGLIACAGAPKPKVFGTAPSLTPGVEIVGTDRVPMHLKIDLPRSAQVAAFYVIPGQGTQMLYPADSTGSKSLPAGVQEIATAFAKQPTTDSSRLLRRPGRAPTTGGNPQQGDQPIRGQRQSAAFDDGSFVLVYAATDSLSFKTLNDRVIGVTLPGYTDEAVNTITKLVRGATTGNGAWSAIAVPFKRQ